MVATEFLVWIFLETLFPHKTHPPATVSSSPPKNLDSISSHGKEINSELGNIQPKTSNFLYRFMANIFKVFAAENKNRFLLLFWAIVLLLPVPISRVVLNYHTTEQVLSPFYFFFISLPDIFLLPIGSHDLFPIRSHLPYVFHAALSLLPDMLSKVPLTLFPLLLLGDDWRANGISLWHPLVCALGAHCDATWMDSSPLLTQRRLVKAASEAHISDAPSAHSP